MVGVAGTEVCGSVVALRCLVSGCGLLGLQRELELALLPVFSAEPRDEEYRCRWHLISCFCPPPPLFTYKSGRRCAQYQHVRVSHLCRVSYKNEKISLVGASRVTLI